MANENRFIRTMVHGLNHCTSLGIAVNITIPTAAAEEHREDSAYIYTMPVSNTSIMLDGRVLASGSGDISIATERSADELNGSIVHIDCNLVDTDPKLDDTSISITLDDGTPTNYMFNGKAPEDKGIISFSITIVLVH